MDPLLQSLETISLVDKLCSAFACDICEDGRISLLTEKNVFIYELVNFMNNEFCDMAFKKKVIDLPKSSIREELGSEFEESYDTNPESNIHKMMRELDINHCIENPATNDVAPIALKWSPKGLQGKSYCVLGILNNFYGLSIMVQHRDVTDIVDYYCATNVTKCIVEQASIHWNRRAVGEIGTAEWKARVSATRPIDFAWSHLINSSYGIYAILFVAHPNGTVTSWRFDRISENDLESKPLQFLGRYNSSLKRISAMYWRKLGVNVGVLCLGSNEGKLSVVRVTNVNQETLTYEEEQIFGGKEDRKKINYITSIEYDNYCFLVTVDEGFLNIILVLEDGTILDEISYDTGNMHIAGLSHYMDNILLLLTGEKLRKLTLNVKDSRVHVEDKNVDTNNDAIFRNCGIVLSQNRVFLGILAYPCRLKDITRHPTPSKFFIYHDASKKPLAMILQNTHGSLAHYWDCFEVLRMLSIKEKKFPWYGLEDLDYDKLTLTQLKSLRWIAKSSENIYNIVPRINGYDIQSYILLHYMVTIQLVVTRMKRLLSDLCDGKELTLFQMRSLDISNMYLKEMVLMKILEKCMLGERFIDDMISVMEVANELEYPDMPPCFWCGEKIIGPTCLSNHKDSRCSISMMQIYLTPGFKCPFCNCVAHIEIAKEYDVVRCPFCDVPMYERYSFRSVQEALADTDDITKQKMEISLQVDIPENCNSDGCTDESISDEDLENHVEYCALTDSEEEELGEERLNSFHHEFWDSNDKTLGISENPDDSHDTNVDHSRSSDSSDDELIENNSNDPATENESSLDQIQED